MNIELMRQRDGRFRADCKDLPGSPPVGFGGTKEVAVANLFYVLLLECRLRPHLPWISILQQQTLQGKPVTVQEVDI